MANDLTDNPWIIDTAATLDSGTAGLRISHIKWVNPSGVAGDACVIQNGAGTRVTWEAVCPGGNFDADIDFGERGLATRGIKVSTLSRGRLYLYFVGWS